MERLGKKLENELKPGSIVVSNVFEIPGWKVTTRSTSSGNEKTKGVNHSNGVYLYRVPECLGGGKI